MTLKFKIEQKANNHMYSQKEQYLVELYKKKDNAIAQSLVKCYLKNHDWTGEQKKLIKEILRDKPKKAKKVSDRYLCAISDGTGLKVSLAASVDAEVARMSKGGKYKAECLWRAFAGNDKASADKELIKLKRFIKHYSTKTDAGYELEALPRIKKYRVKR